MTVPERPQIYHITHVDNLERILGDGGLWCDAEMIERGGPSTAVGISRIKQRRLALPVDVHEGLEVGDCVPFYFCPRSVMLYILHQGNHPDLAYRGGQGPILHLQADLRRVVAWADREGCRWAFSLSNAGARYTEFRRDLVHLGELNWAAVAISDFRSTAMREGKQAEFLVERFFPFALIERIGVVTPALAEQVEAAVVEAGHQVRVEVRREWYY